jgi:membrane carboxypeptidase/penicillin-binding protein
MKRTSIILRSRSGKRAANRSKPLGLIGFLLAVLISIAAAAGAIYGVNRFAEIARELPSPETLPALLDPIDGLLMEPTTIYDRGQQVELWRFTNPAVPVRRYAAITDGESLFYSKLPENLVLATLAALDPGYLQRPEAFLPAVIDTAEDPIPQSLVRDLLLWDELDHPYQEIRVSLLSDQVISRYGRYKVLEWYLNSVYYGHSLYGAAQASRFYFDKDLADLTLGECAMMAAVSTYPALNPLDAPQAAVDNQWEILNKMVEAGFISENQASNASRRQIIYSDPKLNRGEPPAYVNLILREASQTIPEERLVRGGFVLISTIDFQLQQELECTLEILAQRLEGEDTGLVQDCQAGRLLPTYQGSDIPASISLEMNLAVYDPIGGELRALAGKNTAEDQLTVEEPRLPGSLVTPFIYINTFTQGREPASLVWDIPLTDDDLDAELLHPDCEPNCKFLGPVNIRTALVNDLLSPARQVLDTQSGSQLTNTLELFGFELVPGGCTECRVFPESSPLTMIDILQGYGVFVNQGYLTGIPSEESTLEVKPTGLVQIENTAGDDYPIGKSVEEKKIVSEQLAFLINHVLTDQEAWLDPRDREFFQLGRPSGVKLGYVPESSSGWTVGYTPSFVVGAWAGLSSPVDGGEFAEVQISSLLWRAVTQFTAREGSDQGWDMPPGLITQDVCYPSGSLPTNYCPRTVREVFIEGYQPLVPDSLYQSFPVNRETGRLASVFTPPEQIVDRVYLDLPPQAEDWADEAGIERPPVLYDLRETRSRTEGLRLIAPENLSFVNGSVWITGSIPEDEFESARLQYGVGLNPRSWLQIGDEISSPIERGYLGSWDTTELEEGVYALQLVLIKENQGIEKASLLVSVDNSAPEIILITDLSGEELSYQAGKELLLEVEFPNNSEIDRVDFYLDGELLDSRRVKPFITPWMMIPGSHRLRIAALDQAGNRSELEVEFVVESDN